MTIIAEAKMTCIVFCHFVQPDICIFFPSLKNFYADALLPQHHLLLNLVDNQYYIIYMHRCWTRIQIYRYIIKINQKH